MKATNGNKKVVFFRKKTYKEITTTKQTANKPKNKVNKQREQKEQNKQVRNKHTTYNKVERLQKNQQTR